MDKQLSFQTPKNFSDLVEINDLFSQYSKLEFPHYYDLNFIQLHFNPTREEFLLLENIHEDYQLSEGQKHLKFFWPENTGLFVDVLEYLSQENYELGKLELLHLTPNQFTQTSSNPHASIQEVTLHTLDAFIDLNSQADMEAGEDFALNKQDFYRYQFDLPEVSFWLAFIEDEPVGSLILISSQEYLEVDNVLTAVPWRKKGIASELITKVAEIAISDQKEVILLADAEDSPREMYFKQGFQVVATQIHALKEL